MVDHDNSDIDFSLKQALENSLFPKNDIVVSWESIHVSYTGSLSLSKNTNSENEPEDIYNWFKSIIEYSRKPIVFKFTTNDTDTINVNVGPMCKKDPNVPYIPFSTNSDNEVYLLDTNNNISIGSFRNIEEAIESQKPSLTPNRVLRGSKNGSHENPSFFELKYVRYFLYLASIIIFIAIVLSFLEVPKNFAFTVNGIENFIAAFKLPMKLFATALFLLGTFIAIYRLDLSYHQNERQISSTNESNYRNFRDEFLDQFRDHSFEGIIANPALIFNQLYPRRADGQFILSEAFSEFMDDNHFEDFVSNMTTLHQSANSNMSHKKFLGKTYFPAYYLFKGLERSIEIDGDFNFTQVGTSGFTGAYADNCIAVLRDSFFLANIVNKLHDNYYFSHAQSRHWRMFLARLDKVPPAVAEINNIIKETRIAHFVINNDSESIRNANLRGKLQSSTNRSLADSEGGRKYIVFRMQSLQSQTSTANETISTLCEVLNIADVPELLNPGDW